MTEPWKQLDREHVRDAFRERLLEALDEAARETFNPQGWRTPGANDADLPRLFKALDEQIEVLAERYNVALVK